MDPVQRRLYHLSRRHFFKSTGLAMGASLWRMMMPQLVNAPFSGAKSLDRASPAFALGLSHFAPNASA